MLAFMLRSQSNECWEELLLKPAYVREVFHFSEDFSCIKFCCKAVTDVAQRAAIPASAIPTSSSKF